MLRAATKWHPLHDLAITAAGESDQAVDGAVLAEAHARLARLATAELVALMYRRQLAPLAAALAELEARGGGAVEPAVVDEARALVAALEAEPTGHELAPAGTHPMDALTEPTHIDAEALLGPSIMQCRGKGQVAANGFEYWGGAEQPWRNGGDKSPVTDPAVIASETEHKLAAEAQDQPAPGAPLDHATKLRCCGVRVDFLLALTFALDLWDWHTWEVVQNLVKPATEGAGRCRFAELPTVRPFTGAATVFMSHCWGGRWGDLVAAACAGADTRRVVW